VAQHLHEVYPDLTFTERHVLDFLDSLVANHLMVTNDCYYLSLAIRVHPVHTNVDEYDTSPDIARTDGRPTQTASNFLK
jgi:hypothetical protein